MYCGYCFSFQLLKTVLSDCLFLFVYKDTPALLNYTSIEIVYFEKLSLFSTFILQ